MGAEVVLVLVARAPDPGGIRPGEVEGLDEPVVLQKADEDAAEHPRDGNLRQRQTCVSAASVSASESLLMNAAS